MSFLKSLKMRKCKKGQAAIEYFVLFALIAMLTVISSVSGQSFLEQTRIKLQGPGGLFERGVTRISQNG